MDVYEFPSQMDIDVDCNESRSSGCIVVRNAPKCLPRVFLELPTGSRQLGDLVGDSRDLSEAALEVVKDQERWRSRVEVVGGRKANLRQESVVFIGEQAWNHEQFTFVLLCYAVQVPRLESATESS